MSLWTNFKDDLTFENFEAWAKSRPAAQGVLFVGNELEELWDEKGDELIAKGEEAAEELLDETLAALKETIAFTGNLTLDLIRGLIPALIEGAQAGYAAIRDGFRGKEPETIAGLTIAVLVAVVFFTLFHEVKTGPGGAGEYGAGNRPSYPLE